MELQTHVHGNFVLILQEHYDGVHSVLFQFLQHVHGANVVRVVPGHDVECFIYASPYHIVRRPRAGHLCRNCAEVPTELQIGSRKARIQCGEDGVVGTECYVSLFCRLFLVPGNYEHVEPGWGVVAGEKKNQSFLSPPITKNIH